MQKPSDILTESAEIYEQKNADYGHSWQAIGHLLHGLTKGEPITLETPEDFISIGLFTRRLDKLARTFNGEFLSDDLNFESIADSHADETAYAAMHAALLGAKEPPTEYINAKRSAPLREIDTTATVGDVDPEYQAKYEELVGDPEVNED
jgi:hypothetical protein